MELSALAANAALSMLFSTQKRENADATRFSAPEPPANPAEAAPIAPPRPANISFDSVMFLQSEDAAPAIETPSATQLFLAEIQKDPIERWREQILESLGLTEEDLAAMPPEERRAVEEQIAALIEEKLRQGFGADRAPETAAEYLTQGLRG